MGPAARAVAYRCLLASCLVAAAGCDVVFHLDGVSPDAAGSTDGGGSDDGARGVCFGKYGPGGAGLLKVCLDAAPPMMPTVTFSGTVNTDGASCDLVISQGSYESCVIAAQTITLDGTVRFEGTRPIVLLATDTLSVTGVIDVSGSLNMGVAAGGDASGCTSKTFIGGGDSSSGGGGGAGGSFGTTGADGGTGGGGPGGNPLGGGGSLEVRGGCPGGDGGAGSGNSFVEGGTSGGAVYLIAGNSISISSSAILNASGSGGRGGPGAANGLAGGGGSGGASGGLIGLDAQTVDVKGMVFANGGGGGGGAGGTTDPGGDGQSSQGASNIAAGGPPAGLGASGGSGAVDSQAASSGSTASSNGGGGGGGGGVGVVALYTTNPLLTGASISPAPTP